MQRPKRWSAPHEARIWNHFLAVHHWPFVKLQYEVSLATHRWRQLWDLRADPPTLLPGNFVRAGSGIVDVIGEMADSIILFELKVSANMKALGQLLTYRELYLQLHEPIKPVRMVVVCYSVKPSMGPIFDAYGIEVVKVLGLWDLRGAIPRNKLLQAPLPI